MAYIEDIITSGIGARFGQAKKIGQYKQVLDVCTNRRTISLDPVEPFYFHQPKKGVELDLLTGYDPEIDYEIYDTPDVYEHSSQIFHWLLANRDQLIKSDGSPVEFVATRSELANMLVIPNRYRKVNSVLASKFRGTIFLKTKIGEEELNFEHMDSEFENKLAFSGNQFQRLLLSSREDRAPTPSTKIEDLIKLNRYKGVIKSSVKNRSNPNRVHSYSFILPQDLDGVVPGFNCPEESMARFVEIRSVGANKMFKPAFERYDLLKWWARAHLVGIPKIICGYRTEDFKVVETETFLTEDIPGRCRKFWSKEDNISFFDGFLTLIKNRVIVNNPRVIYEFKFNSVDDSIQAQRLNSTPELFVIPEWFVEEFETLE